MSTSTPILRLVTGMACVLALSACATTTPAVKIPTMEESMAQATLASNAGQKEQAINLLKAAATAAPADKAPWVKIAQMRFDNQQYTEAIVSAQEGLVRDPADKVANSIVAISGLRLSVKALNTLSRQNNLNGDTRTESQDLAKLLRESLGEGLLPVANNSSGGGVKSVKSGGASNSSGAASKKKSTVDDSANPFDGLK